MTQTKKDNLPLVSVIIPTYKRIPNIKRALDSINKQTYSNLQIIVVNDDPHTNIKKRLSKYKGVYYINNRKNLGSAESRNRGIKVSRGKYVAFLDDDDMWLPEKIQKQVEVMENLSDEWVGVYTLCIKTRSLEAFNKRKFKLSKSNYEGDFTYELLSGTKNLYIGAGSSLLVRSNTLKRINGFDSSFKRHTDYELIIRLLMEGKIKLLKEALWVNIGGLNISNMDIIEDSKFKLLSKFKEQINALGKFKRDKIYAHQFLELSGLYLLDLNIRKSFKYFTKSLSFFPILLAPVEYFSLGIYLFKGLKRRFH